MTSQVTCTVLGQASLARVLGVFDRTDTRCKQCADFAACLDYCQRMSGPSEPPRLALDLFNDIGGAGPEIAEVFCRSAGKDLSIRDAAERFYGSNCDARTPGCIARCACKEVWEQYLESHVAAPNVPVCCV